MCGGQTVSDSQVCGRYVSTARAGVCLWMFALGTASLGTRGACLGETAFAKAEFGRETNEANAIRVTPSTRGGGTLDITSLTWTYSRENYHGGMRPTNYPLYQPQKTVTPQKSPVLVLDQCAGHRYQNQATRSVIAPMKRHKFKNKTREIF